MHNSTNKRQFSASIHRGVAMMRARPEDYVRPEQFVRPEPNQWQRSTLSHGIRNPKPEDYTGQGLVVLSYDDGENNNYEVALPLHEEFGIPCTFNIPSAYIGRPGYMNSWRVMDCDRRGVEIASHGHTHTNLLTLTDEDVAFECLTSREILSNLASRVETIAIPYSQYDQRVRNIVAQYFRGARTGTDGPANTIPLTDPHWITTSIALHRSTTFADVKPHIDAAVADRSLCVIMLHGVIEDPKVDLRTFDIRPSLLREILAYIASFDRDQLLPINTRDLIAFTTPQ